MVAFFQNFIYLILDFYKIVITKIIFIIIVSIVK
jgi:hypothetical protein